MFSLQQKVGTQPVDIRYEKMKKWKVGMADEKWKIDICNRDIEYAAIILSRMSYITGLSNEEMKNCTGKELIEAVENYINSCKNSIKAGNRK